MKLLKCKICGGDIELFSDKSIGVCDSCGCTLTLPKIDDEQIVGLFNRGNTLRIRGEFDKAAAVFERIIELDDTNAEAHWCLALCRYGIEYVEDPENGERIPTCHRTSYDMFLNDVDYISALEHSDSYTSDLYETEAQKITEIQKAILAISKLEEPFDIFICYKETTDEGTRTKDSALAQELYYELTDAGYKVFFSRITLEEKLGEEYEPYIFAALNSSKVMVVVGTSADNFNAVWVKNEWSRFLSLMKTDNSRMLMPCYRDMDPYDLPDELAMLQSQDMSKLGFIQDITRGIKKILEYNTAKVETKTTPEFTTSSSLERLIQNSETYLKLANYPAAQEVFNRITRDYPEEYRGWWGLIICETKNFMEVPQKVSSLNTWLNYTKQLSAAEVFAPLEAEYAAYTKNITDLEAENEIDSINKTINSLSDNIQTFIDQRNQAEQLKLDNKRNFDNQTAEHDKVIADEQGNIQEDKIEKLDSIKGFGSIIFFFSILVFFSFCNTLDNKSLILALSCLIIGLVLLTVGKNKDLKDTAILAKRLIHDANNAKAALSDQYNTEIEKLDKQIKESNLEISKIEKGIEVYKNYLALGKEKISEYFYTKKWKEADADQQFDTTTERLRSAALGLSENDSSEKA